MPNWTENELTISGPDVQKVLNASRLHDDDWLEAGFEDRISGWDE